MSDNPTMDVEAADDAFHAAMAAFLATNPALEAAGQVAGVRLLAAHALAVAPGATHMLMESSDQGEFMTIPSFLTVGAEHVAEAEWDERVEEYEDELSLAAAWLTWGHWSWEQYLDKDHPYTNKRGGYYALDLRKIAAVAAEDNEDQVRCGSTQQGHEWRLTEHGYSRTWSTTIREDGAIEAYYTGTEDWSENGDEEYWLECGACAKVKPVGDAPILWEGVE